MPTNPTDPDDVGSTDQDAGSDGGRPVGRDGGVVGGARAGAPSAGSGAGGLVINGASGELVTDPDAAAGPCASAEQQQRRWREVGDAAAAVAAARTAGHEPVTRVLDLGCGTGELTARMAGLWPQARVWALDRSELMTMLAEARCLAGGHDQVQAVCADAAIVTAETIEDRPGGVDVVLASFIVNNTLTDTAGRCPDGDDDPVGYARWYRAWYRAGVPVLDRARELLTPRGLLISTEPCNNELAIAAHHRLLARSGFALEPELSRPIRWECDCGCSVPLLVLRPAPAAPDGGAAAEVSEAAVFDRWLAAHGRAFYGATLELDTNQAAQLAADLDNELDGDRDAGPAAEHAAEHDAADAEVAEVAVELSIGYQGGAQGVVSARAYDPFLLVAAPDGTRLAPATALAPLVERVREQVTELAMLNIDYRLRGTHALTGTPH